MTRIYQFREEVLFWAAQECFRQRSGEHSVAHMLRAWYHADTFKNIKCSVEDILTLGHLVDPTNVGFRDLPVTFDGVVGGLKPEHIPHAIATLVEYQRDMTPEQFYQEYQEIHPFQDGNGRTGAILYNWLRRTLRQPVTPPEFVPKERSCT